MQRRKKLLGTHAEILRVALMFVVLLWRLDDELLDGLIDAGADRFFHGGVGVFAKA